MFIFIKKISRIAERYSRNLHFCLNKLTSSIIYMSILIHRIKVFNIHNENISGKSVNSTRFYRIFEKSYGICKFSIRKVKKLVKYAFIFAYF